MGPKLCLLPGPKDEPTRTIHPDARTPEDRAERAEVLVELTLIREERPFLVPHWKP